MIKSNRSRGNAVQRYEEYRESLRIDTNTAADAVNYCIRLAKNKNNCAIIIGHQLDSRMIYDLLIDSLSNCLNINILSKGDGGVKLSNGSEIRILTKNTEYSVPLLLGKDAKTIYVGDGDPRAKKVKEIFDL